MENYAEQLEGLQQFVAGLTVYKEGVAAVQAGTKELNAGMLPLKNGVAHQPQRMRLNRTASKRRQRAFPRHVTVH